MASLNPRNGMLGRRLAAHLLRRTSYNITKERIDSFANKTVGQALDELLNVSTLLIPQPIDPANNMPWINADETTPTDDNYLRIYVVSWWLNEAFHDTSIHHKMQFFLHSNFVVNSGSGNSKELFDYLALLRFYGLGNFKDLALKMTLNPLMLHYLDGTYNSKDNPNENYAREFFELFTVGKGEQIGDGDYTNYTEEDIIEASKVLTGFKAPSEENRKNFIDSGTNIPTSYCNFLKHEPADKVFSSAFQNTVITGASDELDMFRELNDFISMVFSQDETARFICRKVYRFFVSSKIDAEIEQDIIVPLAEIFRDNNYELMPVLRTLLESQHFYDEDDDNSANEIIGCLFKSPLEIAAYINTYFKLEEPDAMNDAGNHYLFFYASGVYSDQLSRANMPLFNPETVAGYPAYYEKSDWHRAWFKSNSLAPRYSIPGTYIKGMRSDGAFDLGGVKLDMVNYVKNNITNPFSASDLVAELINDTFCENADSDRVDYFLNEIFLDEIDPADWTMEWSNYLSTDDDTEVRIALERLAKFILFSPEFQLM